MEAVVSGGIGLLVALGVAGILPVDSQERKPRSGGSWQRTAFAALARVGQALCAHAGIRPDGPRITWLRDELRRRGGSLGAGAQGEAAVGLVLFAVCGAGLLGALLLGGPLGLIAGVALPLVTLEVGTASAGRRRAREIEGAMPEAFQALAIALGSGCSLAQALRFVGVHAREPLRGEFMRAGFSIDCGVPASESLDALLARLRAPGLDLVALALKISQRTGAPLGDLLSQAADLVGLRIHLMRQLDVKTSQARMSARMVAGMPVALIAVLSTLSTDFRRGVAEPAGAVSIALALVLNALAWLIISRIMKVRL